MVLEALAAGGAVFRVLVVEGSAAGANVLMGDRLAAGIAEFGVLVVFRVAIDAFDALLVFHGFLDRGDRLGELVARPVHHVIRGGGSRRGRLVRDVVLDRA